MSKSLFEKVAAVEAKLDMVHENTKDIPTLVSRTAVVENDMKRILPLVDKHEQSYQRRLSVLSVLSFIFGAVASITGGFFTDGWKHFH